MSPIIIYNYRTEESESLERLPDSWADYVPQLAGRGLYEILVETGKDPKKAAMEVLSRCLGENQGE